MAHWQLRPGAFVVLTAVTVELGVMAFSPPQRLAAAGPFLPPAQGNGRIAFTSDRDDAGLDVYSMLPDGTRQARLTSNPANEFDPSWSPDGTRIAFASDRTGGGDIYVMSALGGDATRLTFDPNPDTDPSWSPDGTSIVFASTRSGSGDIYTVDATGGSAHRLTGGPAQDNEPAWSPDGRMIAFASRVDRNRDVHVMQADGSGRVNLTQDPGSDTEPAWSPDGAFIAFVSDRTGDPDIHAMTAAGTWLLDLTPDPLAERSPTFSPDGGTRVAFTVHQAREDHISLVNVALSSASTYGRVTATHAGDETTDPSWQPLPAPMPWASPIEHVVVVYMENHSFDNVLGKLCVEDQRCDGVTRGWTADGSIIDLPPADNHVPVAYHSYYTQVAAINGGAMNGFSLIEKCRKEDSYRCYQQFEPSQVPNLSALARRFVISDATFEEDTVGSWGSHLELASATLDGFYTSVPRRKAQAGGAGWGCDSFWEGDWAPTPTDPTALQPMCVPFPDGTGPFRSSPVPWVPTIMDRLDEAGRTWGIYAPMPDQSQYGWAICPSFADCVFTDQSDHHVRPGAFAAAARGGHLPNLSFVVPVSANSQHNSFSMVKGDNWLQSVLTAVMEGPDWATSAVFITYDDCGCFYDHVSPPENLGIRVPMVIVSPYARAGFTDSGVASFASMLAFAEHTFGLAPLSIDDAEAYDYRDSFDFSQLPLAPIKLRPTPLSTAEREWVERHLVGPPDFT